MFLKERLAKLEERLKKAKSENYINKLKLEIEEVKKHISLREKEKEEESRLFLLWCK